MDGPYTHTNQDLSGLKDILYNNLQRDRGLRAVLEAVTGTMLLLKLQPRLGALFSLVIPSVATITVRGFYVSSLDKESRPSGRQGRLID